MRMAALGMHSQVWHLCLLLLLLRTSALSGVPQGWRMQDRFAGFRFECSGRFNREKWVLMIQDYADELSGFGWVQLSASGSVVGEYRGAKATGPWMGDFLSEGPDDKDSTYKCQIHEYQDTKIRFHFSYFQIMDPRRRSCFSEPPHACAAVDRANSDAGGSDGHGEEL